ncbi:ankyrin repeat domain-containing protein, partial [Aphanizomenon sp. PH219]|nr:ankyrin repeat domain-containing protein [Aphanizomenon sp. 202]MDK2462239.1 ankyrin repeat domain-containing protein [Aphanizomenon sp. PH219]
VPRCTYFPLLPLFIEPIPNVNLQNSAGATALMLAVAEGYSQAVAILLQTGADVNLKNQGGYTALMIAEFNNYRGICNMLRQAGAQE